MRIGGLPPVLTQALLQSLLPKVEQGFRTAVRDGDGTGAAPHVLAAPAQQQPSPATSVQMLVALAAAEPTKERRRKLAEQADRGLSLLERLHAQMVAGAPEPEKVQELLDWAKTFEVPDEPELAALANEIEVRVKVELAKLNLIA